MKSKNRDSLLAYFQILFVLVFFLNGNTTHAFTVPWRFFPLLTLHLSKQNSRSSVILKSYHSDWKSTYSVSPAQMWTHGKFNDPNRNAKYHYYKHHLEFPELKDEKDYILAAHRFFHFPPQGTLSKFKTSGDLILYDPKSNTFACYKPNGTPKTMYRPFLSTQFNILTSDQFDCM